MTLIQQVLALLLQETGTLVALSVAAVFFGWLERSGRGAAALVVVLGVLVLDCALFPTYGSSNGIFQLPLLGRSFDLATAVAVVALVVRFVARGERVRLTTAAALWMAFLLWTGVAGVRGVLAGHEGGTVFYEGSVILHLGALGLLAATTPLPALVSDRGLPRLGAWAAPLAVLIALLDTAQVRLELPLPLMDVRGFGTLGADAATVFASLGAVCGVIALTRPPGRRGCLLPAAALVASPLFGSQRAAMLGVGVTLLVIAIGFLAQGRARVFRLVRGELAVAFLLVVMLAAGVVAVTTVAGRSVGESGLAEQLRHTFVSTAKQQSAQSRRNQWGEALEVAGDAPMTGGGLGTSYRYFEVGPDELRISSITHNLLLDVGLRTGLVGVLLLLAATVASVLDARSVLGSRAGPAAKAVALAAVAVLLGLLAKGGVESVFEKHRLALLIGVSLGLVHAARTSVGASDGSTSEPWTPTRNTDEAPARLHPLKP